MDLFGELLDPIINSPIVQSLSLGLGIATFSLAIALVFWLFRDARRRGTFAIAWGLLGLLALVVGVFVGFSQASWGFIAVGGASLILVLLILIVYSFLRPADFAADAEERELSQRLLEAELETHACPSCGGGIEVDFLICPNCNVTLRRPCDYCARPIKTTWAVCPYCRANKGQAETRAAAPAPARKPRQQQQAAAKSGDSAGRSRSLPKHDEDVDDTDIDFGAPKRSAPSRGSAASSSRSADSGRSSRTSAGSGSAGSSGRRSSADVGGSRSSGGSSGGSSRSRTSTGSSPRSSSGSSGSRSSSSTFKD